MRPPRLIFSMTWFGQWRTLKEQGLPSPGAKSSSNKFLRKFFTFRKSTRKSFKKLSKRSSQIKISTKNTRLGPCPLRITNGRRRTWGRWTNNSSLSVSIPLTMWSWLPCFIVAKISFHMKNLQEFFRKKDRLARGRAWNGSSMYRKQGKFTCRAAWRKMEKLNRASKFWKVPQGTKMDILGGVRIRTPRNKLRECKRLWKRPF